MQGSSPGTFRPQISAGELTPIHSWVKAHPVSEYPSSLVSPLCNPNAGEYMPIHSWLRGGILRWRILYLTSGRFYATLNCASRLIYIAVPGSVWGRG